MKIFLDFDDVVFNTQSFLEQLPGVYKNFGVSPDLFDATYREIKKEHVGKWLGYSFEAHIKKLQEYCSLDKEAVRKAMDDFLEDTKQFVFLDAREFLRWCQEQGYQVSILSFGDLEFQTQKIRGTQLSGYITKILVTDQEKGEALLQEGISSQEPVWFFDDRVHFLGGAKKALPFIKTVLVLRPEGRYQDQKSAACDYSVTNLKEAEKIISLYS